MIAENFDHSFCIYGVPIIALLSPFSINPFLNPILLKFLIFQIPA